MSSLLKNLFLAKDPSTCPHGRPTMVRFGKADLEKIFKRG
jgi:DNA mismatch repair protein MutL